MTDEQENKTKKEWYETWQPEGAKKFQSPNSLKNLKFYTKEDADRARAVHLENLRQRREDIASGKIVLPPKPRSHHVRLRHSELAALYQDQIFQGNWRKLYNETLRSLRQQYSSTRDTMQYKLLTQRVATLHVKVMMMEVAEDRDNYLIIQVDKQLRDYIAQLQKYTEAERREINVTHELIVTTLTKVIAIAEATITDPPQRVAFLKGVAGMISDVPLLPSPSDVERPAIIEGDLKEKTSA